MNAIKALFTHNFCLFITKASNVIFIQTRFDTEIKEKLTFNLPIETPKLFKYRINCLMNFP